MLTIEKVKMDRVRMVMFAPRSTDRAQEQEALRHLLESTILNGSDAYELHFID